MTAPQPADTEPEPMPEAGHCRVWIERLSLTGFRNYESASLSLQPRPVVLVGENGAGKTNILEAVSLLAPGQGLRRASTLDLGRQGGDGAWAVSATVHGGTFEVRIGTGLTADMAAPAVAGLAKPPARAVRIDGEAQRSSSALAEYVEMVWLTPALDGLFVGAAGDRRRFLDRLVVCFDPAHSTRVSQFERAMRQRNRLLENRAAGSDAALTAIERVMAETGVALGAGRVAAIEALRHTMAIRREERAGSPFPWADVALEGGLAEDLGCDAAVDVEDRYARTLADVRGRDARAGRALDGPHRMDLAVTHGPKQMAARFCSTGEQKALLVGLVLAHAAMLSARA
ncbi:MAG: DNA replication/repair protein RecF, partial [Pseudomonadota bacterium]